MNGRVLGIYFRGTEDVKPSLLEAQGQTAHAREQIDGDGAAIAGIESP